ncbi:MAG: HNH endonuclease family protein [Candidatus Nomurabacteria bacterium]|jgi:hypothetical protein|nr:HNH endonuclease family protein [Candidatus Nomurabacteria bacterium]
MDKVLRRRRNTVLGVVLIVCLAFLLYLAGQKLPVDDTMAEIDPVTVVEYDAETDEFTDYLGETVSASPLALDELHKLLVKDWAAHDGYSRDKFLSSGNWNKWNDCNTREKILGRDLDEIIYDGNGCTVLSGILHDPYTGKTINFTRGSSTSSAVQIDHVVALSNAWATGAQDLDSATRNRFANDDLNLLAVDGPANMQKSDNDASAWLPSNKGFRCEYVARQIAVKVKYALWLRLAEFEAMNNVLSSCPEQPMPTP